MMQLLFIAKGKSVSLSLTHISLLSATKDLLHRQALCTVYTDLIKVKIWLEHNLQWTISLWLQYNDNVYIL